MLNLKTFSGLKKIRNILQKAKMPDNNCLYASKQFCLKIRVNEKTNKQIHNVERGTAHFTSK